MAPRNPRELKGIYVKDRKTFFYLETAGKPCRSPLDKLRSVLMQRGILEYDMQSERLTIYNEPYSILTYANAEEKQYEIQVVYLNPHVEKLMTEQKVEESVRSPWRS